MSPPPKADVQNVSYQSLLACLCHPAERFFSHFLANVPPTKLLTPEMEALMVGGLGA